MPDWLRIWNGDYRIGGIAISGCYIPDRRPGTSSNATEADLVIITPQLCVVIQVEGLTEPVDGQMTCPADGPWTHSAIEGPPVHVRRNDTNPLDRVSAGTVNLKNLTRQDRIGDTFVSGLVLVTPPDGHTLTLATTWMPTGIDVRVGTLSDLRLWFYIRAARRPPVWTAEQVHALLRALNLADTVSFADLAAEGFACAAPSPSPAAGARSARPAPTLAGNPWLDLADDPRASFRASRGTGRWRRRFLRRPATGGES
ncbi:hypothetical protein [Nocardia sp. NPDC059239]|uniref:hypothetical protein n=1 Tax=unclassified Nocardia TaxID=2637762 RepID=UPI00367E322D